MSLRRTSQLLAVACAAGTMACAGDSPSAPSNTTAGGALTATAINADVAVTAGNAVLADLDAFASADVLAGLVANVGTSALRIAPELDTPSSDSVQGSGSSGSGDSATVTDSAEHHDGDDDAPAGTPIAPAPGDHPCSDDGVTHERACAFSERHATVQSTIAFVDANGQLTDGFIHGVTDTVRTTMTLFRADTSDDGSRRTSLHRTITKAIGGFVDPEGDRTTNGTGTGSDTTVFNDGLLVRTYAATTADTIVALTFAEHRALNPYPKSGTLIKALDASMSVFDGVETTVQNITRRVVVTFDGTATAQLSVGSTVCQLHLDTRTVDHCQ